MTTFPDISFEKHLQSFIDWLCSYQPFVKSMTLRWYDYYDASLDEQGIAVLPQAALGTVATLKQRFEQLQAAGKEWMNFCAEGVLNDHEYIISVEYNPNSNGHSTMAVNRSGPPYETDGSIRQIARVRLID